MSDRTIRDAINQIGGTHLADQVYSVDAVVESVDAGSRTCDCQVVSGRATNTIKGVRLMCTADDGFLILPEVGTNVCVILSNYAEPYVSQYSGIDKIIFRGGDLGGLIKIDLFTAKLNMMVQKMNIELTKIAAGVTAAGGSYTPAELDAFSATDYENKAVTHG